MPLARPIFVSTGSDDKGAIEAYKAVKKKTFGKDEAKRAFLEDWVIDPTFAKSKMRYTTLLESIEAESSEEEIYTRERLEHTIGKSEAKNLIDGGLLETAKDKYGREGWKYARSRKRRAARRTRAAQHSDDMDLNAEQAKRVREQMASGDIGLTTRRKPIKPSVELTAEEKVVQEAVKTLKKHKAAMLTGLSKCSIAIQECKASKHPLSKKLKEQLESHEVAMKKKEAEITTMIMAYCESSQKVSKVAMQKLAEQAEKLAELFKRDLNMAKSL